MLFFSRKASEAYVYLKDVVKTKLDNLNTTQIRSEFKLDIHKCYIIPSMKFFLNVHEPPKCHMEKLDTFVSKHIK